MSWERCTPDDLAGIDIEALVQGLKSADPFELADAIFLEELQGNQLRQGQLVRARVFRLVYDLLMMQPNPHDWRTPFGPVMTLSGCRSPITDDFAVVIDVITAIAERVNHPVLRARLCDVVWVLDRKRWDSGVAALEAYVATVELIRNQGWTFRQTRPCEPFSRQTADLLERALSIGRSLGGEQTEFDAARRITLTLRDEAFTRNDLSAVLWLFRFQLDYELSEDFAPIARVIETSLVGSGKDVHHCLALELWRIAARGYKRANHIDDSMRCAVRAAECLADEAERLAPMSALAAGQIMSAAIAQLASVPDSKDRRRKLRHRLVDIQASAMDEMTPLSLSMDLTEIATRVRNHMETLGLVDALIELACLTNPPTPEELVVNALEIVERHPLSSLLGASHLDYQGKIIHRTSATEEDAVQAQIAKAESVRRRYLTAGACSVARVEVRTRRRLTRRGVERLIERSFTVPPMLLQTIATGLMHYLDGELTEAVYVLTPMVEAMLRHVLRLKGHEVTIFDEKTQTQRDRNLSSLLYSLRSELDEVLTSRLTTDIENVFVKKPGPHLRHVVAHGLGHDGLPFGPDAEYGCWVVYRLAVLPLVGLREKLDIDDEWIEGA